MCVNVLQERSKKPIKGSNKNSTRAVKCCVTFFNTLIQTAPKCLTIEYHFWSARSFHLYFYKYLEKNIGDSDKGDSLYVNRDALLR